MTRSSQQAIAAFILICAFFLAGCATTSQPGARDLIHGYSLKSIEVTISPDAYTGLTERLDDLDEEEFATMVKESLETAMDESIRPSFSGTSPAIVRLHVDEMVIASRVGRAVLGNQSLIGGKVEILDVLTEKMIAEMHFREQEKDVEFSGNLGILVEVTKNVLDGAMNNRVEKAAKEFADRVKDWLES